MGKRSSFKTLSGILSGLWMQASRQERSNPAPFSTTMSLSGVSGVDFT